MLCNRSPMDLVIVSDESKSLIALRRVYGMKLLTVCSLAYAELRLITSKLLFHFDLRLAPQSDNPHWVSQQKTAMIWEKLPLHVELTERKP
jgi:hypothetical protein